MHTLKGLSANLGADRLHSMAKLFEESPTPPLLEPLSHQLHATVEELSAFLQQRRSLLAIRKKSPASEEELNEGIDALIRALQSKRPKKYKDAISLLRQFDLPQPLDARLSAVEESMKRFNFTEALEVIK